MKNKKILFAFISVAIILIATFLIVIEEQNPESKALTTNLYFFNETAETIVNEERDVKYENDDFIIDAVLEELKKGPQNSKNKPIFDKDVKVLSVSQHENGIVVDLSKQFLDEDNSKTLLTTYAIVKSLCQLSEVNKVMVTCKGNEITSSDGTVIGFLSDKDIDLVTDTMTKDSKRIALYFADVNNDCLIAENRTIKVTDTNPIEQYIVNELIKGAESSTTKSLLASDTQLISAQTTDGVCFVNFKSGFVEKNIGDSKKENLIIYSIVNSLCELDKVTSVQFLVDGKKIEKFGSIDISTNFEKNKNISK